MEVTDENLATLANYLHQTLNPDPSLRRPGKLEWHNKIGLLIVKCVHFYYLIFRRVNHLPDQ